MTILNSDLRMRFRAKLTYWSARFFLGLIVVTCCLFLVMKFVVNGIYIMPAGTAGCFGGQAITETAGKTVRSSFSLLHSESLNSELGSAVLLAGGKGRMLTASHVISPVMYALDYTGKIRVRMKPVYLGQRRFIEGASGAETNDIAVIEPDEQNSSEVLSVLQSMPGLQIVQLFGAPPLLSIRFEKPGGPDVGSSGAAVTDSDGNIAGILTRSASPAWPRSMLIGYGRPLHYGIPADGWGIAVTVNPIAASYGQVITGADSGNAVIASHPWNNCVVQNAFFEVLHTHQ